MTNEIHLGIIKKEDLLEHYLLNLQYFFFIDNKVFGKLHEAVCFTTLSTLCV